MTAGPLWTPSPERVAATAMDAFRRRIGVADTVALHRWSITEPDAAWRALWDECGLEGDPGTVAFDPGDGSMLGARFFPDARLNMAAHLLRGPGAEPAIVWEREDGASRTMTWDELRADVAAAAAALQETGVSAGDRVVAWMPNVPETVVLMIAAVSLGAVFSSTSPDFGVDGVLDRFGQIEPVVLVASDGYLYGGRRHDSSSRLTELVARLPTLRRTVLVPHLDPDARPPQPDMVRWDEWLAPHRGASFAPEVFGFDHPGFVLYSSGTTGKPKCIVHRAAGVLLKHAYEHQLHCDVRAGDRVFYFTTCGWMMWNWLTSALASRAAIVLFEGSPMYPHPRALFDLADRHGITLFGTSARFLDGVAKAGIRPAESHSLASVRTICSTGSPLSAERFAWVYEHVKADVHLASISGGTDLCGCLVGGDPTRPVWAGEIQGPVLGMDIDVFDDTGHPLPRGRGELVCRGPFPSMPLGFWNDPDGERYRRAYFDRFPGVWTQGDFATWTEHGGMVIHGRSDSTLNAGGVRIGTAEIYRVVEDLPEVVESVAVGQEWESDTRIVLFVRLADDQPLTDELVARLRTAVRDRCSPRHVPARVVQVRDLPRTRSGKLAELAVVDVVNGRTVRALEGLANPEALDEYRDRPELAR